MKNYIKTIRQLPGEGRIWAIAFRRKTEKLLFEGNGEGFIFVPNSFLYWRADPFLFDYKGDTYLFAELYNRIIGKGVIGVAKIKDGRCGRFKVCLDESHHLSYPCVFESKGDIYMMPESGHSGSIIMYRCVQFPNKWERVKEMENCPAVDTTPIPHQLTAGDCYLSTINNSVDTKNSSLWLIDFVKRQKYLLKKDNTELRPAGHIIHHGNAFIRPVQNCTNDYGTDVIFRRIEKIDSNGITETEIARTFPSKERAEGKNPYISTHNGTRYSFDGIHTYNVSSQYEVVDLAYREAISMPYFLHKVYKHFMRKG